MTMTNTNIKIQTEFIGRCLGEDWAAFRPCDEGPDGPFGRGATELEAILDLEEQLEQLEDKDLVLAEAAALNEAHDAEVRAWANFKALKNQREALALQASAAFRPWQDAREHQKSLGGECI